MASAASTARPNEIAWGITVSSTFPATKNRIDAQEKRWIRINAGNVATESENVDKASNPILINIRNFCIRRHR